MGLFGSSDSGKPSQRQPGDYEDVGDADLQAAGRTADKMIQAATVSQVNEIAAVRRAIYDKDIVLLTIEPAQGSRKWEQIIDEVNRACEETGSQAVKDNGQIIIAPHDVGIAAEPLVE